MANNIPLSGATDAAGGYLLPPEQGGILTNGLLKEAGAIALAGDARTTSSRKEVFAIWQGAPTAAFVGEGGTKPVTGGEFGPGTITVKKVASIVTFTDEMIEDVQSGDLNVLVDGGVRQAITDVIDANAIGHDSTAPVATNFDAALTGTTSKVTMGSGQDALPTAISAAMGSLEAAGYRDFGVLVPSDYPRYIRDARAVPGGGTAGTVVGSVGLFQPIGDPVYGAPYRVTTNLNTFSAGGTVAVVFSRPNVHVRIRQDVSLTTSNEATLGGTSLFQQDLTAIRYVTRLGYWIHDINRAVVQITK